MHDWIKTHKFWIIAAVIVGAYALYVRAKNGAATTAAGAAGGGTITPSQDNTDLLSAINTGFGALQTSGAAQANGLSQLIQTSDHDTVGAINAQTTALQTALSDVTSGQQTGFSGLSSSLATLETALQGGFSSIQSALSGLNAAISNGFSGLQTTQQSIQTAQAAQASSLNSLMTQTEYSLFNESTASCYGGNGIWSKPCVEFNSVHDLTNPAGNDQGVEQQIMQAYSACFSADHFDPVCVAQKMQARLQGMTTGPGAAIPGR